MKSEYTIYSEIFKKVLRRFNKDKIHYVVLRNYEFVFDSSKPLEYHLDIVIQKKDMLKAYRILENIGRMNTIKYPPQFSKVHQGSGIFIPDLNDKAGFDIQNDGIYWNDLVYLPAKKIIPRRVKKGDIYTLSDEDSFIMYLCHLILGKRSKFKQNYRDYPSALTALTKKDLDKGYIEKSLADIFNKRISKKLIGYVYAGNFKAIHEKIYALVLYFIIKKPKNWFIFAALFFRWFFSAKYCPFKKVPVLKYLVPGMPMISIIGPDGSGKSTMAKKLVDILKNSGRNAELVYSGRGKFNLIPIKKIGKAYKILEQEKIKKDSFIKKIVYTLAAPVYTSDLLLRYFIYIFPKRRSGKVIVTDRYASDILLMPNVPLFIKKILLSLFPKPTMTFYLYNSPKILYKRKHHSKEDLKRQLALFPILQKKFNAVTIKTKEKEKDIQQIKNKALIRLGELGYFKF